MLTLLGTMNLDVSKNSVSIGLLPLVSTYDEIGKDLGDEMRLDTMSSIADGISYVSLLHHDP